MNEEMTKLITNAIVGVSTVCFDAKFGERIDEIDWESEKEENTKLKWAICKKEGDP